MSVDFGGTANVTGVISKTKINRMAAVLGGARLLCLGMWLGAALFFSFAVAPSAFAVLPSRELAGGLVSRTLAVINVSGFVVGVLALLTSLFAQRPSSRLVRRIEATALFVLVAGTAIGHWIVSARMHALRATLSGPVEALAASDPVRVTFNDLHGYSVILLSVAMLAALTVFVLNLKRQH